MDLLTQGLLGAATAQSVSRRQELRTATVIGLLAGMAPDLDTLIRSSSDPLLFLDFHRYFTHALIFVPVIAALVTVVLTPWLGRRMGPRRVFLYALAGAAFAGVLDACTSYGTHLLWPFVDRAVAWRIVSIVDPVITVALVAGLALGLLRRRPTAAWIALALIAVYLGGGVLQQQRALDAARGLAEARGHRIERLIAKPTFANLLLWRSLYLSGGVLYADAVRLPPFARARVYEGESALLLSGDAAAAGDPLLARLGPALPRFARFADGLLVRHPDRPEMVGDARFSMLPTRLKPLWGITRTPEGDDHPAQFVTDRSMSAAERQQFVDMLLGRELR